MLKGHAKLVKILDHTSYVLKTDGLWLVQSGLIVIGHHVRNPDDHQLVKIHLDLIVQNLWVVFPLLLTFLILQIEGVRQRQ